MKTLDAKTRVSLKNILFATDFSPAAEAALPYALGIARRFGSKVFGVHAKPPDSFVMVAPELWPSMAEAAAKESKESTARLKAQLAGVAHEVVVEEGETRKVLLRMIEEKDIDLIVMGTHGRTGMKKLLMGSIAEEILRQARCPVLTVGPSVAVDSTRAVQMREILYATDLSPESQASAPYAISLAQEHEAHLSLLHVLPKPGSGDLVYPEQYVDSTLRLLHNLVPPEAELWCKPEAFVASGEPAEQILELAEKRHVDLIVLGVRDEEVVPGAATHLPIATVHKVVAHAKCPVLTVRTAS